MITKEQAQTASHFEHVSEKNSDKTPVRCRAMGRCKTWVTRPTEFKLPVKYGLYQHFYITPANADQWNVAG